MNKILASVALNLDLNILSASFPLLEESKVEAIEWSYDALFNLREIPDWFQDLLKNYSDHGRLIGHGIFFSLFRGKYSEEQERWLKDLTAVAKKYHFDHITEHFGFFSGPDFHSGAPLPVPFTPSTLTIGQDRLKRIQQACNCPVGLENLAFAYSLEQVKEYGFFLEKLVEPINGFIILDLHNVYCQLQNFNINETDLLELHPLDKVREIHISGGSWVESVISPTRKIRRDTHDGRVPEEVFKLLEMTIEKCPNLKYVVLEQLGVGLKSDTSKKQFYDDFLKMQEIVKNKNNSRNRETSNDFIPVPFKLPANPPEDLQLFEQQIVLSHLLESNKGIPETIKALKESPLANTDWKIELWNDYMIETAINIARKWKK
jgi:uncharacterized protein